MTPTGDAVAIPLLKPRQVTSKRPDKAGQKIVKFAAFSCVQEA
jgi:hypothetical protein